MDLSLDITVQDKGGGFNGPANFNFLDDINGQDSYEDMLRFLKQAHIRIAKDVLKEEQKKGFDKDPRKRIDNVFDKIEEQVKDFGKIEYFAKQSFSEAMMFIYKKIEEKSAIQTGTYKMYNYVFFRGSLVARSMKDLETWLEGRTFAATDRIRFVNLTPYGRRLEYLGVSRNKKGNRSKLRMGKASSRYSRFMEGAKKRVKPGTLVSRPNGTYYLALRAARRKFKGVGRIKHEFVQGTDLANIPIMNVGDGLRYKARTEFVKDGRPYLYSSIVVDFNELGAF